MCDCYEHKCNDKKCNELLPIHIGDFCTYRDNIEVFCPRHLPKRFKDFDGAIWKFTKDEKLSDGLKFHRGYRFGIRIKDISKVDEWCRKHDWDNGYEPDYWKQIIHPNVSETIKIKDWGGIKINVKATY